VLDLVTTTLNPVDRISDSFGSAAAYYDQHAQVQAKAADRLVEFLQPFTRFVDGPILEFGCGTGFITDRTSQWWPHLPREVTDLSPDMLAVCAHKLAHKVPVQTVFRPLDIQTLRASSHYGLILSGLTVQWVDDLPGTLKTLGQALKPGGLIAVSYFNSKSFPQWKSLCREAKVPFTGNPLPKLDVATHLDFKYKTLVLNEIQKETYASPLDFFRHLKHIGADVKSPNAKSAPEAVRRLQDVWMSKRRRHFTITYGITYALIQRLA
jgi:malonyl-CoA O-methyltransferase